MADDEKTTDARPEHPTPLRGPDEGIPAHPKGKVPGVGADIAALATGLKTTLGEFFSPQVTLEYPEDKSPRSERYRGRHYLRRYENGLERCIGCELCAAACPSSAIFVQAADNDPAQPATMTLMGGPIDPRVNPTARNKLATSRPLESSSFQVSRMRSALPSTLNALCPSSSSTQ